MDLDTNIHFLMKSNDELNIEFKKKYSHQLEKLNKEISHCESKSKTKFLTLSNESQVVKDHNSVFFCNNILNDITFTKEELNQYSFDDNKSYDKNVLYRNDLFELILIKWKKNKASLIHGHPNNGCLLKLLYGKLREDRYREEQKSYETNIISKNDISYMHDDFGLHKITGIDDSYSLHLYSPPNFNSK